MLLTSNVTIEDLVLEVLMESFVSGATDISAADMTHRVMAQLETMAINIPDDLEDQIKDATATSQDLSSAHDTLPTRAPLTCELTFEDLLTEMLLRAKGLSPSGVILSDLCGLYRARLETMAVNIPVNLDEEVKNALALHCGPLRRDPSPAVLSPPFLLPTSPSPSSSSTGQSTSQPSDATIANASGPEQHNKASSGPQKVFGRNSLHDLDKSVIITIDRLGAKDMEKAMQKANKEMQAVHHCFGPAGDLPPLYDTAPSAKYSWMPLILSNVAEVEDLLSIINHDPKLTADLHRLNAEAADPKRSTRITLVQFGRNDASTDHVSATRMSRAFPDLEIIYRIAVLRHSKADDIVKQLRLPSTWDHAVSHFEPACERYTLGWGAGKHRNQHVRWWSVDVHFRASVAAATDFDILLRQAQLQSVADKGPDLSVWSGRPSSIDLVDPEAAAMHYIYGRESTSDKCEHGFGDEILTCVNRACGPR